MSLTFLQLQNAVLADGFSEGKRADAKTWIQYRHAWLWGLEEWTFRYATTSVTFTSGAQAVGSVPSDFHIAIAVYDSQGCPLRPYGDFREFLDLYNTNSQPGSGTPEAFTVVGGSLLVGPNGDGSSGLLVYEKSKPNLVADTDTSGLPEGFDVALIHGGKAEGFKLLNVPLWSGFDDDFTAAANAMRRDYLTGVRASGMRTFGSYRPGR